MKRGLGAGVMLAMLSLASCQRSTDLNDTQRDTVIQGVQQMAVQFFDDLRTHNAASVMAHLDSSEGFFWIFPPDTAVVARADLITALRAELEAYPSIEARWLQMKVEPLTSRIAAYTGVFEQVGTTAGGDVVTTRGIETALVVMRDDTWKFLSGQTTLSIVEPE